MPHSLSYIDDAARALLALGSSDQAWGQVWHLPVAPAVTGREFLTLACTMAGRPVRVGVHGRLAMTVAGWFSAFALLRDPTSSFARIASLIPPLAPFVSPRRVVSSVVVALRMSR